MNIVSLQYCNIVMDVIVANIPIAVKVIAIIVMIEVCVIVVIVVVVFMKAKSF